MDRMAFEKVVKKSGIVGLGKDEISINNYGMTLGENASAMSDTAYIEVFLDIEGRRVGLKPTNDKFDGYKVAELPPTRMGGQKRKTISGSWAERLTNGIFVFKVEDDMLVLENVSIAPLKKRLKFPKENEAGTLLRDL